MPKTASHPPLRYSWIEQPDDITCGPSCLAMLHAAIANRHSMEPFDDVLAVCAMSGTDDVTGTTPERIRTGLSGLGMEAGRHLGPESFAVAWDLAADRGDPLLLRTLTQGIKHWVLATDLGPDGCRLLDPWLGEIDATRDAVEALVAPREHEVWLVDGNRRPREIAIRSAGEFRSEVVALLEPEFGRFIGDEFAAYLDEKADWELSEALFVDGRLAGAYLLKEGDPSREGADLPSDMTGLRSVEGVALAVAPDLRGNGYGRLLRDRPRALGFELAWGLQMRELGNLDRWLARRTLVGQTPDSWITAGRIAQPEPVAAPSP